MSVLTETYVLSNGVKIPKVGFGTWQVPNGEVAYNAVSYALKVGYRHVDTAYVYGNEESVGKAIRESGIPRNEIFVTSKLPADVKTYDGTLDYFERTMKNLGLDYLDLYLIHWPWPWNEKGKDYKKENIDVWRAMEKLNTEGRIRAIGVSNFDVEYLQVLLDNSEIKPMVNQIKFFIGNTQEEITQFCQKNGILVEAYSPLATGRLINNGAIQKIADKYHKTVAQICLRYVLQRNVLPLPKSTTPARIEENAKLDFEIAPEDMEYLNNLTDTVQA
ncbi:aldo/keto reductase [Coprothermobacter platensis]|uniref:aldo/keto reductase n=1 Tax=Coprothermobacter platensis TaxID=108819 RepID=UPI0003706FD1|nr:aldo/keto reductase [Coprothermobacter platensis]